MLLLVLLLLVMGRALGIERLLSASKAALPRLSRLKLLILRGISELLTIMAVPAAAILTAQVATLLLTFKWFAPFG